MEHRYSALNVGAYNRLAVAGFNKFGVIFESDDGEEILLPQRDIPRKRSLEIGDELNLFVYHDNKNRLVATTQRPFATVGQFADLQVAEINDVGIFLDWGLPKDLLMPFSEEVGTLYPGDYTIVHLYLDDRSARITASAKIDRFLDQTPPRYRDGEKVNLLVADQTAMGFKVIINHQHWGLVHNNELFRPLEIGETTEGFIKQIREDGKIDISLQPTAEDTRERLETLIMRRLSEHGGRLPLSDKSNPADIHKMFGVSKGNFKRAIGGLFKEQKIIIRPHEIIYNPTFEKER